MKFRVVLSPDAECDLEEIHDYVAVADSPANAQRLIDRLLEEARKLETAPHRGTWPPELARLGLRDFRQTWFKPYRIIYSVAGQIVRIMLIADGRRNFQTLLQRRLLQHGQ